MTVTVENVGAPVSYGEEIRDTWREVASWAAGEIDRLRDLLKFPFSERPGMQEYTQGPPEWARDLTISCSS